LKRGHTLLFAKRKCGNTKEECPHDSIKSPAFLEEKFFTRCELQGTSCKFLEKRRKDEIATLSTKARNDRGRGS